MPSDKFESGLQEKLSSSSSIKILLTPFIPRLSELSKDAIVHLFLGSLRRYYLEWLNDTQREQVIKCLPVDLPLHLTVPLIHEQSYWKRYFTTKWPQFLPEKHESNWKQLCMERLLADCIENFTTSNSKEAEYLIGWVKDSIRRLTIRQLRPCKAIQNETTGIYSGRGRWDVGGLLALCTNLEELRIHYALRNCATEFEWDAFGCSLQDCCYLSQSLPKLNSLQKLSLPANEIADSQVQNLCESLNDHPSLREIDISHNAISDPGCLHVAKLATSSCPLETLLLGNNKIGDQGVTALALALPESRLLHLDVQLNAIGDVGAAALCQILANRKCALHELVLASNALTETTASNIKAVLCANCDLKLIDVSHNPLGKKGGEELSSGIAENKTLVHLDVRLCQIDQKDENTIYHTIQRNADRNSTFI